MGHFIAHPGRKKGSKNYGGLSLLAKTMAHNGLIWHEEIAREYARFRQERDMMPLDAKMRGDKPDNTLLMFWSEALPYIAVRLCDKLAFGPRKNKWKPKKLVSDAAVEALTKLEGRQNAH